MTPGPEVMSIREIVRRLRMLLAQTNRKPEDLLLPDVARHLGANHTLLRAIAYERTTPHGWTFVPNKELQLALSRFFQMWDARALVKVKGVDGKWRVHRPTNTPKVKEAQLTTTRLYIDITSEGPRLRIAR